MNHMTAGVELADLIMALTNPTITKARKYQLEINARAKALAYLNRLEKR